MENLSRVCISIVHRRWLLARRCYCQAADRQTEHRLCERVSEYLFTLEPVGRVFQAFRELAFCVTICEQNFDEKAEEKTHPSCVNVDFIT